MSSPLNRFTKFFSASWRVQVLLCSCGFGFTGQSLRAQLLARFPVKPEQVVLAMQGRDWLMDGVQVRLAAPVTATVSEPALDIKSVAASYGHETLLRVTCRVSAECLPFFASAVWPAEAPMPGLPPKRNKTGVIHTDHAMEGQLPATLELQAGSSAEANVLMPPVIRAGSLATLVLDGPRVHIRMSVVVAQTGHVGDTVRVTTPDRKQVYVAEVLTPELLKGEL